MFRALVAYKPVSYNKSVFYLIVIAIFFLSHALSLFFIFSFLFSRKFLIKNLTFFSKLIVQQEPLIVYTYHCKYVISQLTNAISRVLQKLLKYFNGTLISTFFVPLFPILAAIFVLNLNEALIILSAGKSVISPLAFKYGSSL